MSGDASITRMSGDAFTLSGDANSRERIIFQNYSELVTHVGDGL